MSTVKDAQENSLKLQKTYYTKYIKAHSDWIFAELYSNDGVSGLSVRNRDGFNSMVEDALAGKFDLILTKSLSRFARNTVDSLTTIRSLKAVGVAVYFEKEKINTLDANGEFLITLMSSFAEEESRSISENVRWAYRHRFAQGIYYLSNSLLGYSHNKRNEPVINEDETRIVRFIFMLAITGKSCTHIASILSDYNIPASLSDGWHMSTVKNILQNERYMGDALLQKTVTTDFLTKKIKKNEVEAPQYYVENGHPAIVSKEVWHEVQSSLSTEFKKNCTYLPIARKIFCGDCKGLYGGKV